MPFDWAFSSPRMVCDCLADDFKSFLDPREYMAIGRQGSGCGHRRYAEQRLPNRWQGFTWLHHDPLRKRQDHDYLKRCVERFRVAARSPGRKLFVVSCFVDSPEKLEEIKAPKLKAPTKASWAFFAPTEISRLCHSLKDYGISNFKLVAAVLCVAAASEVSRDVEEGVESLEPWVREIPLEGPCDVDGASMVEIHLGESTDFDPFKVFFQKPENEQAFDRAVLGNSKVSPELDQLQDDYKPSGYREKLENGCPFLNLEEASFVCRCCKAGFASRNRLFSHIRGSSTCMRFVAETDLRGFESLKEVKPQIYALIFGLPVAMTWSEVKEMLLGTLALVGENIQLITHEHQGSLANSDVCCPSVAVMILAKMSCAPTGNALLQHLRETSSERGLVLHGCVPVSKAMASDWPESLVIQHFAYLLPFEALCHEELEDFTERQKIYRSFKQSLNQVQKEAELEDLQMKMIERMSFQKEFVLVKVAGSCCADDALQFLGRALAVYHGAGLELCLPTELLYLESQRFPELERRHGQSWALEDDKSLCALNASRGELHRKLAEVQVDWSEVICKKEYLLVVGSGAYGCVASFKDKRSGETMAVKKITNAFDDLVDGKRILREVKLLRQLDHDNIIRILDMYPPAGPDFEDIYIVTDLMETDLHRVIYSKQPLTEEHHQYFVHQVLRGLAYLHSANIVHRDIKPSNLLVNKNCDLKICDFGLSRVLATESEDALGRTDYVVTRWYRAPEVMLHSAEYTVAIDVWAVGCILCELIMRRPLFAGNDHVDQIRKIIATLGTPTEAETKWLPEGGTARSFLVKCPSAPKVNWKQALPTASDNAIEVVCRMVTFDPTVRISVADTLRLKYFDHLFDEEDMVHDTCSKKIDWSFDNFEPTKPLLQSYVYCELASFHPEIVDRDQELPGLSANGE
ncbi:unnamed protein product [Durusdinium trenchii]|uniref:Mitogen-activated protein kinase n=1 Tax=Durusdinium trenchii TaxID=1381693 RepID=A0ABP0QSK6_9DINO